VDLETNQRAIRQFLNLRLIDVERATGIAAVRISESERGLTPLRPAEQRIVTNFLREKLASALAQDR
jgi:transcriptional regulator with XRE-family HTH domain